MELFLLLAAGGLFAWYYSKDSSSSNTTNKGPFTSADCNAAFSKIPADQKNLVMLSIDNVNKGGSKGNIAMLANSMRKNYPDVAKCLDAVAGVSPLNLEEGEKPTITLSPEFTAPPKDEWYAKANEFKYTSGPGNKVYAVGFMREGEQRGIGIVERLDPTTGRIVSILAVSADYVKTYPLPAVGEKIRLEIPKDVA